MDKKKLAKLFASIGGKAGTGACKTRTKEHYERIGREGAAKRWKKKKDAEK